MDRDSTVTGTPGCPKQIPVYLRRLRKEDIAEVVEIEREAFSPLWVSSQFKRGPEQ